MTMPAAAASAVYPLIVGPPCTGVVLGSSSQAVIIGLRTPAGPRALSLLGPAAAGAPNGVRVPGATVDFARLRPGDLARVGHGKVRVAWLCLRVMRGWRSRVFRIAPDSAGIETIDIAAGESERGVPAGAIADLDLSLETGAEAIATAVDALVGLGRGLTPGGDDVLAGLLIGLHATGQTQLAAHVGDRALDRVLDRTTMLSGDLLRLAAAGHACVEALDVVRAVHTRHQVPAAVHRLLSIGHTSGADLATGLAMGLGMGLRCGRNMSQYGEAFTTTR